MKLIFSRKGFDSSTGKFASPILPPAQDVAQNGAQILGQDEKHGPLYSLPIPAADAPIRLRDIGWHDGQNGKGGTLARAVHQLTGGRIRAHQRVHLDPDLRREGLARAAGWRPVFGQTGAAQGHLAAQGVDVGDIFLFYGWFRQTERVCGRLSYVADAPHWHVLFGWLQIGSMIRVDNKSQGEAELAHVPQWARYHPHCRGTFGRNNTLYVATQSLRFPGSAARQNGDGKMAGAGVFAHYHPSLRLTAAYQPQRSLWRLPGWFMPRDGRPPLTYHGDPTRWRREGNDVLLKTVGRGQEFVLDCAAYPEALPWLQRLLARNVTGKH